MFTRRFIYPLLALLALVGFADAANNPVELFPAGASAPGLGIVPKLPGFDRTLLPYDHLPGKYAYRFDLPTVCDTPWAAQMTAAFFGEIQKGDKCTLSFHARTPRSRDPDGQFHAVVHVQENKPPKYDKLFTAGFTVGEEWEEIVFSFESPSQLESKTGGIALHLGGEAGCVEIGGIRLINHGKDIALAALPQRKLSYSGRAADAPWRDAALARIEQIRKGNFQVTLPKGLLAPGDSAEVEFILKRHAFGFGTAVTARWMSEPGAAGEKYRQIVDECFSRVVLENDLKPFGRELGKNEAPSSTFRHSYTANALAWLNERGYTIRGHYLLWGPFEPWSEKLRGDSQKIRQRINDHMDEVLSATGTKVTEWDAINHPASWDPANRVDRVVGPTLYAETMRRARGATKLPLWVNEDQVFRPGRQQEDYFREIEALIAAGLPPDGIGNMAHFDSSFLPSPEEMLRISDRFARLVPRLQITEFDVVTNGDEALQADFLRDALIVAFSHPAYTGFVMWGFWERAHWKPEAALWRGDWTEKAAAAIWKEWVCNRWRTKHKATITGTDTPIQFSGFFGQYEVVVKKAGAETRRFFVNLVPERKSVILQ